VPRDLFEGHWHQVMGADMKRNPKLMHLGIFIRGNRSEPASLAEEVKVASLDFRKFGSLNLIVAKFGGHVFPVDLLEDVKALLDPKSVRPNAFLFLRMGRDGKVAGMEGSGLEEGETGCIVLRSRSLRIGQAPPPALHGSTSWKRSMCS
jgi:hypothetical protein